MLLLTLLAIGCVMTWTSGSGLFTGCKMEKEGKDETGTILSVESESKNSYIFVRCVDMELCGHLPVCKRKTRRQAKECGGAFSFLRKFVRNPKARSGFDQFCCTYVPIPSFRMWKQCEKVRVRLMYGMKKLKRRRFRNRSTRRRKERAVSLEELLVRHARGVKTRRFRSEERAAVANAVEKDYIPKRFYAVKEIKKIKKTKSGSIYEVTACQIHCEKESDESRDPDEDKNENKKENNERNEKNKETPENEQSERNPENNERIEGNENAENEERIQGNLNGDGGWYKRGGGCIGGDGLVDTPTGPKRVDQLQFGDQVLVNVKTYRPIKWMHHKDHDSVASFLLFRTEDGHQLALTHYHVILSVNCPGDTKISSEFLFANRLTIGSCVRTVQEDQCRASKIVSIEEMDLKGLYAPITESGTIVVNGVLTSCYSYMENQALMTSIHNVVFRVSELMDKVLFWWDPSSPPSPEIPFLIRALYSIGPVLVPNPNSDNFRK